MTPLADRLHCVRCKGRLNITMATAPDGTQSESLFCSQCETRIPAPDGIPDFIGSRAIPEADPNGLNGSAIAAGNDAATGLECMRLAAGDRWPASLGDVLELGCGGGQLTQTLAAHEAVSTLLAVDSNASLLRACRDQLGLPAQAGSARICFVRLGMGEDALRDATFDTVIGAEVLARTSDVRSFLAMVHRVMRPGSHAVFVAPNRRYLVAVCHALAEALVLRNAREQTWPESARRVIRMIGRVYRRHVHQGDVAALAAVHDRHVFEPESLEDLARAAGFAEVGVVPMRPDRLGGETILRMCRDAGAEEQFAAELARLAVSAGAQYFSLLGRQDSAPSMLVWLTKGVGPALRTFAARPALSVIPFREPEAALGGVPPRWSIERPRRRKRRMACSLWSKVGAW